MPPRTTRRGGFQTRTISPLRQHIQYPFSLCRVLLDIRYLQRRRRLIYPLPCAWPRARAQAIRLVAHIHLDTLAQQLPEDGGGEESKYAFFPNSFKSVGFFKDHRVLFYTMTTCDMEMELLQEEHGTSPQYYKCTFENDKTNTYIHSFSEARAANRIHLDNLDAPNKALPPTASTITLQVEMTLDTSRPSLTDNKQPRPPAEYPQWT